MKKEIKDKQLKEIINYYIKTSGIRAVRPDVDFSYGEIIEFQDGTINAKINTSKEGQLRFFATDKLRKLQEDNSLKAKRCMHQLIAHEIGHLFYQDNVVDYDVSMQNNFMRLLSVMRELRADIIGTCLVLNGKYINELNLNNSELAFEQAFDFVPINLKDKKLGYPDKQSRIYYTMTFGLNGLSEEAIVDMIIRYCISYKITFTELNEGLRKKIKRVRKKEKKMWYSYWVNYVDLAEVYYREIHK